MEPFGKANIGRTDLSVTRLGLGGAPLGGLFESVSDDDARDTVETAWSAGVRFFDTAPFYGHGTSELRIGRALKAHPRSELVLASKVGRVLVPATPDAIEDHQYRDLLDFNPVFDFSADGIQRSFDSSLERLGVATIDIVHLHDPDDHYQAALNEGFSALARLKEQGLIRAIGAGMNQWEMLLRLAREAAFDCFLLAGRYTLLDQSALAELLPECEKRHISIILGGPYNSGILAVGSKGVGHFNYEKPPDAILRKTEALEAVCERHDVPLKAAALQFPLAHPAVASVIPGARNPAEVKDNVAMATHPIARDFWAELRHEGLIEKEAPVPAGMG